MKTRQMMMLAVLLGLLAARDGLAFYNPETGRWLNRDPKTEVGFWARNGETTQTLDRTKQTLGWNVDALVNSAYLWCKNDSLNHIDWRGLKILSIGCTPEQKGQLENDVRVMCAKALDPKKRCCGGLRTKMQANMKRICDPGFEIIVNCLQKEHPFYKECHRGTCAFIPPVEDFPSVGKGLVYVCPVVWRDTPCGTTRDCIILHELLHGAGLGLQDPNSSIQAVERCVGCKESYK